MKAARYRLGQFIHYLINSAPSPAERAEARAVLGPRLAALFERMTPGEQAHSLRVLRRMRAEAEGRPLPAGLLQAALLHDVGKTCAPLGLAGRVVVALAGSIAPARWGQGEPRGWRRPFVVAAQHAAWGAELCAAAGADALAVTLVRRHQDKQGAAPPLAPEEEWLRRLQHADDEA
jgi:hypothetical protein